MTPSFAVIVGFELVAGARERFLVLVNDNAAISVTDEPGCFRFDVLVSAASPDIMLYEVYADRAAFDAHLASAHFAQFDAATRELVARKTVTVGALRTHVKEPR